MDSCVLATADEVFSGDGAAFGRRQASRWLQEKKVSVSCAQKSPGTSYKRTNRGHSLPVPFVTLPLLFSNKVTLGIFLCLIPQEVPLPKTLPPTGDAYFVDSRS